MELNGIAIEFEIKRLLADTYPGVTSVMVAMDVHFKNWMEYNESTQEHLNNTYWGVNVMHLLILDLMLQDEGVY